MEQQIDLKSDSGWTVSKTLQVVSLWVLTSTFLGFLIVNSYFAFFGFWDSDFLKVQYVAAGTLFLLLVSFPALCAIIYFKIRKYLINCRVLNKGIFTRIWTYAVEVVFLLFALYLSAMPIIVSLLFGHFSMNPTISIDVISIFWMVIVWISVIVIFKSRDKITEAKNTDSVFKKGFMYFSAYYIFCLRFLY